MVPTYKFMGTPSPQSRRLIKFMEKEIPYYRCLTPDTFYLDHAGFAGVFRASLFPPILYYFSLTPCPLPFPCKFMDVPFPTDFGHADLFDFQKDTPPLEVLFGLKSPFSWRSFAMPDTQPGPARMLHRVNTLLPLPDPDT